MTDGVDSTHYTYWWRYPVPDVHVAGNDWTLRRLC